MTKVLTSVDMIQRLVSFNTTSRESNIQLIEFVRNFLSENKITSKIIYNDDGSKANLHAIIGPRNRAGIVLSGHTDVVPVDGQDWNSDPFDVVKKNGRLYGRGTADMKSFIAIILSLVPKMIQKKLSIPIHLALSYDEEVGCLGAPDLINHIARSSPQPYAAIVGEPTNMTVVNSHKGVYAYHTEVKGLEGHSSAPHKGVNAIQFATELMQYLFKIANEKQQSKQGNDNFDPPYTSVHVGLVNGGTALNIIPRQCSFIWEYRLLPEESPDEIINRFNLYCTNNVLPRMQKTWEEASIRTTRRSRIPPLLPSTGSSAETLAMTLVGSNKTYTVAYGTEAGIFQEATIPTVVCGPGSIDQAHKPNEFIELSQVEACEKFVSQLIGYAEEN